MLAFATLLPPLDDLSEVNLTVHMAQHILVILAGVSIARWVWSRRLAERGRTWAPRVALAGGSGLLILWHLPLLWDTAVLDPWIHVVEHASFLGVGFMAGSWMLRLSDSAKIGALMSAFFGHMGYALALVLPLRIQVYSLYPIPDQTTLGWALLLTGPTVLVGVAHVISRNPDWLGGASGATPQARRDSTLFRVKVPGFVMPAIGIVLVAALVGYFAFTGYVLAAQGASTGRAAVTIIETPVSWQYSPRDIVVVLGVNATVTWKSQSISYDTVTSGSGTFDSGPVPPGGTFTFAFASPGVYEYHCAYHPWMAGTVTVLAG